MESIVRHIWVYRKNTVTDDELKNALCLIPKNYGSDCMVFTDETRNMDAFIKLKNVIASPGLLVLMSLKDIGRTKADVLDQALWLIQQKIEIVVLDCPSTLIFDKPDFNLMAFQILTDMYRNMPDYRNLLPEASEKRLGRPKIEFPQGWDELYAKWRHRDITAKEFMDRTGLKKGSFYHLISAYDSLEEGEMMIWKIG